MAQLVINISDERYKRICDHTELPTDVIDLLVAVEKGTLLNNHGQLIDVEELMKLHKEKTMFVDEIRVITPLWNLNKMKEEIKHAAECGRSYAVFSRPTHDMKLAKEAEWFKNEGFIVEEATCISRYDYYPELIISWEKDNKEGT